MHSVRETLAAIQQAVRPVESERCPLAQAGGRTLAAPILLDRDAPPFDKALVDGFALRAADAHPGASLRIIGQHDAGGPVGGPVEPGTAVAINTGAVMPEGADAVVMLERTRREGDRATLAEVLRAGAGIDRRGSHGRGGTVALKAGTRLRSAALAVAATVGAVDLCVARRVRVAVLATGDELIPPTAEPRGSQIRNSNSALLLAEAMAAGAVATDLGMARDDPAEIRQRMAVGLRDAEVLLVSGGMSMGTRDWVPRLLEEMGVTLLIQKVAMKPGKPFLFGVMEGPQGRRYVAGLPGNPVSGWVCCRRFVAPLLACLSGQSVAERLPRTLTAVDLPANGEREFYQPAVWRDGGLEPLAWRGSGDVFTAARAEAWMVHPPGAAARPAGTLVDFMPLGL